MIKLDAKIKIIEHLTEKEKDLLRLILARGERLPAEYDETDFSGGVLIGLAIERKEHPEWDYETLCEAVYGISSITVKYTVHPHKKKKDKRWAGGVLVSGMTVTLWKDESGLSVQLEVPDYGMFRRAAIEILTADSYTIADFFLGG